MSYDHDNDDNQNGNITESTPNIALLNAAEVDQQVATAHRYPRSIKQFMSDARDLVTLSEEVAESCGYALSRKSKDKDTGQWVTKNIEGPSARFAEIIFSCWGNARAGTRIVDEGAEFVTAQGFMFDLQKNVAIQVEVPRRITDSQNRRYKVDMIGVTANAAASIALRNAILKVIPKALWEPIYQDAKRTSVGTEGTLSNKRLAAMQAFQKRGASAETIYEHFGVKGIEDITLDHLATLKGYLTALKEGDTTIESLFGKDDPAATGKSAKTSDDIVARAQQQAPAPTQAPAASPAPAAATGAPAAAGQTDLLGDGAPELPPFEELKKKLGAAKNMDALLTHADWIRHYPDEAQKLALNEAYEARKKALAAK